MKEKVNYKKEYSDDNLFNIMMNILMLGLVIYDFYINTSETIIGVMITPIVIQLYINLLASRFFCRE